MNKIIIHRRQTFAASIGGSSAYPAGSADTSSRLDAGAAMIRNATIPPVLVGKNWDVDRSGDLIRAPEITDQP